MLRGEKIHTRTQGVYPAPNEPLSRRAKQADLVLLLAFWEGVQSLVRPLTSNYPRYIIG